jgi:hypothetical protein
MVSVLFSKAVDGGFFGGVMVSVRVSKVVDHGFIGGVMVSVLTAFETRTLTIMPPMNPRSTAFETAR